MKHQIPTSKLQSNSKHQALTSKRDRSRKHQIPSSNIQRNSNNQAPNSRQAQPATWTYPAVSGAALRLNENPTIVEVAKHPFDLEERTAQFGEDVVRFSKKVPRDPTNNRLIDQLVGCGTSIGANYCEANEGVSKKDFRNTIGRCVKEAKETKHFLRMIAASEPKLAEEERELYREAKALRLIFASIFRK
jgi:four helix bundle protein